VITPPALGAVLIWLVKTPNSNKRPPSLALRKQRGDERKSAS